MDPALMSREQLVQEVLKLRNEVRTLQQSQATAQPAARRASTGPLNPAAISKKYEMSLEVLMIGGVEGNRSWRSLPLTEVLEKSFCRDDVREADTPVYAAGGFETGRFSSTSDAFRGSAGSQDADSPQGFQRQASSPITNASFGPQPGRGGRPALLNIPRPKLDPDAIVSNQTLHNFSRMYGQEMQSPRSSSANSILSYLTNTFARGNDFQHNCTPAQMEAFGRTLISLCTELGSILATSDNHVNVTSPCYVFGDIHGNFRDLNFFVSTLINFNDLRFTPYRMLFLGDYVDRGSHGVEVVALLFAMKVLAPQKVTLLRGNHEDTLVNGDMNMYGETSFRRQAHVLFGSLLGEQVWSRCNRVFSLLPLSANIDGAIFCTHGGLPRYSGGPDNRMEVLRRNDFPRFESFFQIPERETADAALCRQVASDVCWSDPAEDDGMTDQFGFGNNPRGHGVILFGSAAVDTFLNNFGFEYIFRAHQEKSDGLKISKNARVVTIFSTSSYVGHDNGAGVVYVADGKIRLIIKQPDEVSDP